MTLRENARVSAMMALSAVALLSVAACDDMSTPADLDREQILAIRATPSALAAGESVILDSLLAGPEGQFLGETSWRLVGEYPGLTLEVLETGNAVLRAEEGFTADVPLELEFAVARPGGPDLVALKRVPVASLPSENPSIASLNIGSQAVDDNGVVTIERGVVSLQVEAPIDARIAWYTSLGEIRFYRDEVTSIETTEEDGDAGWLAVVVRDSTGGVDWHVCQLIVR